MDERGIREAIIAGAISIAALAIAGWLSSKAARAGSSAMPAGLETRAWLDRQADRLHRIIGGAREAADFAAFDVVEEAEGIAYAEAMMDAAGDGQEEDEL